MRIGIDISQLAYPGSGVAAFLTNLVTTLIREDSENQYVLFFSSLRKKCPFTVQSDVSNVELKTFTFPPSFLDTLWNRLHIFPIEWLIGPVDVLITSDWVEPPSKAKKITILYDLIVYTYPQETAKKIVDVQKRKLKWVKKESKKIICISEATKNDAMKILGIPENTLEVIYPGL